MDWIERLEHYIANTPDQVALEWLDCDGAMAAATTYAELGAAVNAAAAHLLALGVRPGDRVALCLHKSPAFVTYHLAALHLGCVSLPLNPDYTAGEVRYYLEDSVAAVLLVDPATARLSNSLREFPSCLVGPRDAPTLPAFPTHLPALEPDATALMIYTSGTTGRPKGAEITHANLSAQLEALREAWSWTPADRLLHVLPLFHVHGLIVALHAALHAGATATMLLHFDAPLALQLLATRKFTVFMGVPTIHRRLVAAADQPVDLSHVRLITSGSDRLPDDLYHAFRDVFGQPLLERYGMTETGMLLSNPLHGERRPGSVGRPLPGVAVRIADPVDDTPLPDGVVGEVQVRGANVFRGYWRQPEKTAAAFTADGWFRTGDLGQREPGGDFTLKGRAKDLIITGGYNVYPAEVEQVLLALPAVTACAVFGVPDDQWGEQVVAAVVLDPEAADPAAVLADLAGHCRSHLAPYKVPRRITNLPDLPRNAMGKVQKNVLRARLVN